jgi:hypothetical protein
MKMKHKLTSYTLVNARICSVRCVGTLTREEGRKLESECFYNDLQIILNNIGKNENFTEGDFDARICSERIEDVDKTCAEGTANQNGRALRDLSGLIREFPRSMDRKRNTNCVVP